MTTALVFSVALSATGLDVLSAFSASVQAIASVGPGLGDIVGPADNFSTLPDLAKWLLSFEMLLGRLELFTMLVLLAPPFWRW
jgi:trk system potassium uptake protein TrkH